MGHHYLYRHFAADGTLLYVGISLSAVKRLADGHRHNSTWFASITRIEIESFETKGDAQEAELTAIRKEQPKFNLAGRTERKPKIIPPPKEKRVITRTPGPPANLDRNVGKLGLTQRGAARFLGASVRSVNGWIAGKVPIPRSAELLLATTIKLGLTPEEVNKLTESQQ